MDFAYSEEQEEFRGVVRRFVEERWPVAEVRRLAEAGRGYEPATWRQMAEELGLPGLAVAEAHGGQGFDMLELGIAQEELGRQLAGGPFFASACLATSALQALATPEEQAELLPALAAGETVAALALGEDAAPAHPDTVACRAEPEGTGGGVRLCGEKRFVLSAPDASLLLVLAREPDSRGGQGLGLYALAADAPGLTVVPVAGLDLTRRLGHLRLEGAPARRLGDGAPPWPALRRVLLRGSIALGAEQVGAAARCLESAVAHVKERYQFGRPVGSFQAVKHRAADTLMLLELARSAASYGAWVAAQDGPELAEAAHLTASLAAEACAEAAATCIHLHGGMGFTWEHDAHLYYRRARACEVLLGEPRAHRAELARALGLLG